MSLWFLVVGLSFFIIPTGLAMFPARLPCVGGLNWYIKWACITQTTLRLQTEKAHRFKSSGMWCQCICYIKITHKSHSCQRSATQPYTTSAKTKTQNQCSFSFSSLRSPDFHLLVLTIPVRHHTKTESVTMQLMNEAKAFTKCNTW